jgi:8-oxo-dGTP diphosphatase
MNNTIRQRPTAIIIKDDKVLLMKRERENQIYFVFPGGHVEDDETPEQTLEREIKEELNFDITNFKEIFRITQHNPRDNMEVENVFYKITDFTGELKLGGPEVERMKKGNNNYYPTWYNKEELIHIEPIYPIGIKEFILTHWISLAMQK